MADQTIMLTQSPSDGCDIRWYFSKQQMMKKDLSSAIPSSPIAGNGDYLRFSLSDSLLLESAFKLREDEYSTAWWKEFADWSDGPLPPDQLSSSFSYEETGVDWLDPKSEENDEPMGVPVKGGLYEVDLSARCSSPVYWGGLHRRVLRGSWFALLGSHWLPLREDVAEQLEVAYRNRIWKYRGYQPSGLYAARVNLSAIPEGQYVLFTGEDSTWEAWLADDHSWNFLLSGAPPGVPLRRGYLDPPDFAPYTKEDFAQQMEEEFDNYCSQVPVSHLVFMVHGIGQKMDSADLVTQVNDFRHNVAALAQTALSKYQRLKQRCLFIPVQWRRGLLLGSELLVGDLTLQGVRSLRDAVNETVHDVLYYMSPAYCQDIIDSVTANLNFLFRRFKRRNPSFDGKVSVFGHSLGSVLLHDILCHQIALPETPRAMSFDSRCTDTQIGEGSSDPLCLDPVEEGNTPAMADTNMCLDSEVEILQAQIQALQARLQELQKPGSQDQAQESLPGSGNGCFLHLTEQPWPEQLRGTARDLACQLSPMEVLNEVESEDGCRESILSTVDVESAEAARDEGSRVSPSDVPYLAAMADDPTPLPGTCSGDREAYGSDSDRSTAMDLLQTTVPEEYRAEGGSQESAELSLASQESAEQLGIVSRRRQHSPWIKYADLEFQVESFFAVGSPLGLFLALRNIRLGFGDRLEQEEDIHEEMPACRNLMNIFHPFDPVAYRIEPLISSHFVNMKPALAHHHTGRNRLHVQISEFQTKIMKSVQDSWKLLCRKLSGFKDGLLWLFSGAYFKKQTEEEDKYSTESEEEGFEVDSYAKRVISRLTGSENGRIDYMLQEATFEHQYIVAFQCHLTYWSDKDTALLVLEQLYKDIPRSPSPSEVELYADVGNIQVGPTTPSRVIFDLGDSNDVALTFQSGGGRAVEVLAEAYRISRAADPLSVKIWGLAA